MKIKIIFSILMFFCNISWAQKVPQKHVQATFSRNISNVIDEAALKGEILCFLPIKTIETIQMSEVESTYSKQTGWEHKQYNGDVKTHELSTKFINIDMVSQIEFDNRYQNKIVVSFSNGDEKENNYVVQYNSDKEAIEGMKKIFQAINTCKKKS